MKLSPLFEAQDDFATRHIGTSPDEQQALLEVVGVASIEQLIDLAVPSAIRTGERLELGPPADETSVVKHLRALAAQNEPFTSLIGMGYHGTITPGVILRNVLENPAWYTAYTPYQPEISQGRLEALLNFQTIVCELTGLDLANASLLDEGSAAAEAMLMARRICPHERVRLLVDPDSHPQTVAVLQTRADPLGIEISVANPRSADPADFFGVVLSYPGTSGEIPDWRNVSRRAAAADTVVIVMADPLALVRLESPANWGAHIVVGSLQRFGVPMGFGGPHPAFIGTRAAHARSLPGRLVGVSADVSGRPALRLALQAREQHIRREKATSNICTAQALLAVVAAMYAVWHGPGGLRRIADRVHRLTSMLAAGLRAGGLEVVNQHWFDTLTVRVSGRAASIHSAARAGRLNLRHIDEDTVGVSFDETTTPQTVERVLAAFGVPTDLSCLETVAEGLPQAFVRRGALLEHPVFNRYHSEQEMLRYLRRLSDRDLALDRTMIPLGSCTMKLNATTEMLAVTWPEFANVHPFAPLDQVLGYLELIRDLERMLIACTGYDAVSLQPNAGSQGELAGLLAIRAYHQSRGDQRRTICLIPSSAHGTNAASAVLAGMQVVVVACDENGNVDVEDLKKKASHHEPDLAAIMVTYPSTHGVYEDTITDVCNIVHQHGGQVYLDGANLNALIGIAKPGRFGGDVSHLNLHKTFCIPHGGGGPGVGPVAVRGHLAPFLPTHPLRPEAGPESGPVGPVSSAPWGSAGILAVSWAYITLMGASGLREATCNAVLNANYVARRLDAHFPVLYTGKGGFVAHECILDLRPLKRSTGVTAEDVAKRLIDYGFHAPTMSFPVAGTLMVEPTESEGKRELDRFCDAMISIRAEIEKVRSGEWPAEDNPLVNAPHTAQGALADDWNHSYSREVAVFPLESVKAAKYFPPIGRIDQALGDRNLVCSCPPIEDYTIT